MANNRADGSTPVVLVTMPFGPLLLPSIGLTLLKGALAQRDITSEIMYLTIPFSRMVGTEVYSRVANGRPTTCHLVGEWIFSAGLFDQSTEQEHAYVEQLLRGGVNPCTPEDDQRFVESGDFIEAVLAARAKVPEFLDSCVEIVARAKPRVVGFTSVFQQQLASLALAKRLKSELPDTLIVFGGANCEGMMGVELVRQFPFVDAIVSGEGEAAFPDLIERVWKGQDFTGIPGVYTHQSLALIGASTQLVNTSSVRNIDDLPYVRYDDFFAQAQDMDEDVQARLQILFETSRGCWWGDKQHCTFCGLNGASMSFRSKSARRALDELSQLSTAHPGRQVQVVDNILDMRYFKDLIPALASQRLDLDLFYEVKANLKKGHLEALAAAGIRTIQPGIESLSTAVLTRMRKGVSAIQNVQMLKWCKELGIRPSWNLLWGFPGEDPADYQEMARLAGLLTHLPPPTAAAPIRLDRFSPLFDQATSFGFTDVRPVPAYEHIYAGLPRSAVHNLAYYFGYSCVREESLGDYTADLAGEVAVWRDEYDSSDLFSVEKGDRTLVWDLRPNSTTPLTVLTEPIAMLYRECDTYHSVRHLSDLLSRDGHAKMSSADLHALLRPLCERRLMMCEDNHYLSLAIPLGVYNPTSKVWQKLADVVATLGRVDGVNYAIPASMVEAVTI